MNKNWKFSIIVMSMTLFIVGCGSSIQPGQTVWINLPGKSISSEGYAVAKLTKIAGGKAHLNVSKLIPVAGNRLQAKLRGRKAVIPSKLISPYKQGKAAWNNRRKAARQLSFLLKTNTPDSKKEVFIDGVVANNSIPEFTLALSLYRLRNNYLSSNLSVSSRISNIPYVLRKLKSLSQNQKAYQTILDHLSAGIIYSTGDGKRKVNVITRRGKYDRNSKRMQSNLFTQRAASTVREVRRLVNSSIRRMPTLEVVNNMSAIINAEKAYLSFVSDNGKRYSRVPTKRIIAIRKRQIGNRILPGIRSELISKADLKTAKSEAEAISRYETAASKAEKISRQLGIKVFSKSTKQNSFVLPVRERLARLKREQKSRLRVAMNRNQLPVLQAKAIKRYLSDYPQSKNIDKVKTEQARLEKSRQAAAELHSRRLKKIILLMTSRNQYQGSAGYQKKTLRFKIKISKFNKNSGSFSGRMTWPEKKGAINRITGKLNSEKLTIKFTEVAAIKRGNWRTGSRYSLSMASDQNMKGVHSYRYFILSKQRTASLNIK